MTTSMRSETDTLGTVDVPANRYWGAQTQRALENFALREPAMPLEILRAYGLIKGVAAEVNHEAGLLDAAQADGIRAAADEVFRGELDAHFPLAIWQSGSGTQTNMNVNEVIANRANQRLGAPLGAKSPIHPNDHVNRSQSSNDTFPTAMHMAAALALHGELLPALDSLVEALKRKRGAFDAVVKLGRTHLQDALPLTLGQEMSGWIEQLQCARVRLVAALGELHALPLGGTAVGTGYGAPDDFGVRCCDRIAERTGRPFTPARNRFAALAAHDAVVAASAGLNGLAVALTKIANDVRFSASGPRGGLGELRLPANEPGSSIMPGKVNPTQCELLTMIAVRVMGHHTAISIGGSQGHFQLNVYKPLLIHTLLESCSLLAGGCRSFATHLVAGLEAESARLQTTVAGSLMLVTALVPRLGYDVAARVARRAEAEGSTLREACLAEGVLAGDAFDALVRPETMVGRHGRTADT
ncbi:MAG: class II fumarate hydratase [Proteobacteria bacterium]|nr:class II fumarate hydratase [Pseudomonadota bacterium]